MAIVESKRFPARSSLLMRAYGHVTVTLLYVVTNGRYVRGQTRKIGPHFFDIHHAITNHNVVGSEEHYKHATSSSRQLTLVTITTLESEVYLLQYSGNDTKVVDGFLMTHPHDKLLDWTARQGRILTAHGKAPEYYTHQRGFVWDDSQLPQYHLVRRETRTIFAQWRKEENEVVNPIVGVWDRPLFFSTWEHSTNHDETVHNVQTQTLFVDLRIPTLRQTVLVETVPHAKSVEDLNGLQLRYYARQHVFAGYSKIQRTTKQSYYAYCCERHHCMDWNFVGQIRPRPNKWWIEVHPQNHNLWMERAYATDPAGQHYYGERWEGRSQGRGDPVVALRTTQGRDGILVIVKDHFNYCRERQMPDGMDSGDAKSLVELVDTAVAKNDLETARVWLSMEGGHGRISNGWILDSAIEFWKEGTALLCAEDVRLDGSDLSNFTLVWKGQEWTVFESSVSFDDLTALFAKSLRKRKIG